MQVADQLTSLLREAITEYAEDTGLDIHLNADARLLGADAIVDSLGLVIVVTGFEAKVNDAFNAEIVLANEKAMSMNNSPFRSLSVLADYAADLLREAGKL